MVELPPVIKNAVDSLTKLPSVGEKSAFRMVMNMTNWRAQELESVATAINDLKNLKKCEECYMYAEAEICSICLDIHRQESKSLCLVESVSDLLAIEKSGTFKGLFHILGGVLNPLLGIGPDELKIDSFVARVARKEIEEIILAINPSVEGDATCSYLKSILPKHIRVERIGFGVPIGGSLEYLDAMTISKALENRKQF